MRHTLADDFSVSKWRGLHITPSTFPKGPATTAVTSSLVAAHPPTCPHSGTRDHLHKKDVRELRARWAAGSVNLPAGTGYSYAVHHQEGLACPADQPGNRRAGTGMGVPGEDGNDHAPGQPRRAARTG